MSVSIYPTDDGAFVVSQNCVWIPGAYDSRETAERAVQMPDEILQRLQDAANERAGGRGGIITATDLASLERREQGEG